MGHGHNHSHPQHTHGANRDDPRGGARRLRIALGLAATYLMAEVVGGWWTGSLALLADAGHMLGDVAALALALGAMWLSGRPPDDENTFGHHRAEVVAALLNGLALLGVAGFVVVEAIERLRGDVPPVLGGPMLGIAAGGLVVNVLAMVVLHRGDQNNLNLRGAFLHVAADALGSVGAMTSGALVWLLGWTWADPAASILIAVLVSLSALALLRRTFRVLMQVAPLGLDMAAVRKAVAARPGVVDVHDIHAWTLASGRDSFSAHLVLQDAGGWADVLGDVQATLEQQFGLRHVTLQPELKGQAPCGCCFAKEGVQRASAAD